MLFVCCENSFCDQPIAFQNNPSRESNVSLSVEQNDGGENANLRF